MSDFGLSKLRGTRGSFVGTLYYSDLENCKIKQHNDTHVDYQEMKYEPTNDIWAMGCIGYQIITRVSRRHGLQHKIFQN